MSPVFVHCLKIGNQRVAASLKIQTCPFSDNPLHIRIVDVDCVFVGHYGNNSVDISGGSSYWWIFAFYHDFRDFIGHDIGFCAQYTLQKSCDSPVSLPGTRKYRLFHSLLFSDFRTGCGQFFSTFCLDFYWWHDQRRKRLKCREYQKFDPIYQEWYQIILNWKINQNTSMHRHLAIPQMHDALCSLW